MSASDIRTSRMLIVAALLFSAAALIACLQPWESTGAWYHVSYIVWGLCLGFGILLLLRIVERWVMR